MKRGNRIDKIIIWALFLTICLGGIAIGQQFDSGLSPTSSLIYFSGNIDPDTGDLLLVSNTWRYSRVSLRRFDSDGRSDRTFNLDRVEACCAIQPSFVTLGGDGSIYSLEYSGSFGGFYIYKHTSSGEVDIDWGQMEGSISPTLQSLSDYFNDEEEEEDDPGEGDFDEGDTVLDWNRGGGRLQFFFGSPSDMAVRSDGSLLILDSVYRYVYLVSPDGSAVTEFIGNEDYYPQRPQRMVIDSMENIYIVDAYEMDITGGFGFERKREYGVFKFDPNGNWELGWGESSGGINDEWREGLDLNSLMIDGEDNLIALGSSWSDGGHSEVFVFDVENGDEVSRDNIQYRHGFDSEYLGIIARPDGGFAVLDEFGFEIQVSYYTLEGVRENKVNITDLYSTDL